MRYLLAICLALAALCAAPALYADEKPVCEQFAWSLADEKAWFDDAGLAARTSGDNAGSLADGAFSIKLMSEAEAGFVLPSEGPEKDGSTNGAKLTYADVPVAGRYQVTLSGDAWIDMIQEGKYVPSVEHTGVDGCADLRKSVRFDLAPGPLTLQLGHSTETSLKVAIKRVQ